MRKLSAITLFLYFFTLSPVWAAEHHSAMEKKNLEAVKKMHLSYQQGDLTPIFGSVSDKVDWQVYGPGIVPFGGNHKGLAGVKAFFEKLSQTLEFKKLSLKQEIADGNQVVITGTMAFTVKQNGKSYVTPFAHVFVLDNQAKVLKFRGYTDTASLAFALR